MLLNHLWGRLFAILIVICSFATANEFAQTPSATPQASPTPSLEKQFLKNILKDQRAIWTAPLHIDSNDMKWLVPAGLTTGALIATDKKSAGALHDNRVRMNVSRDISYLGSVYGTGTIAASLYLVGRTQHDAHLREAGLLGAEALINGYAVSACVKTITQRPRPLEPEAGDFFKGGRSFPSGHAVSSWTLATVVANEYHDKRLVQVAAYGLATAVSISRFTGRNHFLSDIFVGSVIGYGVGHYVYRTHHDPSLDSPDSVNTTKNHAKLYPLMSPHFDPTSRTYGISLMWMP
jgi:membrane-associated phospholipid phosphatase